MNKSGLMGIILVISLMTVFSTGSRTQPGNVFTPAVKDTVNKAQAAIDKDYGKMPLAFIPNKGQMDRQVYFYLQGKDKSVYFTSTGLTYALASPTGSQPNARDEAKPSTPSTRWVVKLDFVNAREDVKPVCLEKSGTVISYFKGKAAEWQTGLQAASKIIYRNLWPGIDLVYYGTVNRMKYEFIVHPGADPSQIKLAYRGAESVMENSRGQLEVQTPVGGFSDDTPIAWQEISGKRETVSLKYALEKKSPSNPQDAYTYGFSVGKYDKNETLILDPAVLIYCGYIGGSSADLGYSIAVDTAGCAYITGFTWSDQTDFPVTVGPDLTQNGGYKDAFVAKVNADGSGLVYCGYIGGTADDIGNGIAIDGTGCAYVTGYTGSSEASFPVTIGPDLTFNGGDNAFVAKVSADGAGLVYCGYIGDSDNCNGIAVDGSGCAYVTGRTNSTETTFPVTVGPDLTYNGGSYDAFVAKIKADGTALDYCGYIGGSGDEQGNAIAVDTSGCAYITGKTFSTETSFPVTVGPDLIYNGFNDAFVAKVKADGSGVVYCGYIGGSNNDVSFGIGVDGLGCAYITGDTRSTETSFPVAVGPDLTHNGDWDDFVAKVKSDGTGIDYCGYIGGAVADYGRGIAVNGSGCAYITGYTYSTDTTFPVTVGPDLTYNGGDYDAFVAKIRADGTSLDYCGYIGGSSGDYSYGIAVDGSGYAYVAGYTTSTETTFPVTAGPDLTYNGGGGDYDAFVAKISSVTAPEVTVVSPGVNALGAAKGTNISVTFDQDMNSTGINSDTFVVHAMERGLISGTYSYDNGTRTATFDPAGVFAVGEMVTVTLTTGIESTDSIPLARPYMWSFTIGADSGYGTFITPAPTYGTGDNPNSSFAADFDSDGDIDAATANMDSNNVSVLLNNGSGTFAAPAPTYGVGNSPRSIFGGDFDHDGDIDLAATNGLDNTVSVLLNNGNGTFVTPAPTYGVGSGSNPLIGGDFDGDGDIDLATGNGIANTVSVLLNNGDGTFVTPAPSYGVGSSPRGIYRGDFDNDGDMDLVTANYNSNNVSILLNNGDGTFATPAPTYGAGLNCRAVFTADLDNDGDIDLATGNEMSWDISVLLNNGNGTFAGQTSYNVGIGFGAVFGGDFDNDGDIDLAAGGANIYIFWNNGSGTFQTPAVQYNAHVTYNGFSGGDLDGNGSFDLALASGGIDAVTLLLNRGPIVAFLAGTGGSISGPTPQSVPFGGTTTAVEAVPDPEYDFANWTGNNGFVTTTDNPLTVTNVTTDMTITANFVFPNVTGHVTDSGSNGAANVNVTIFDLNYNQVTVQATDSNGDYTIYGLAAGNYKVWFDTQGNAGNLAREWYSDQRSFNTANTITVTDGNTTGGIDAQLENGGTIAGIVLDSSANGIENVRVVVYDPDSNYIIDGWTNGSGNYSIPRLLPGSYKLYFDTSSTTNFYVREWYNNKSDFQSANTVPVTAGSTTTANAVLADGGTISGTVTDSESNGIANVNVNIYDTNHNFVLGVATEQSSGNYTIKGLAPGNYKAEFNAANAGNYLDEWHNNQGSFDDADLVSVTAGNVTGLDAQLTSGGILSGQVTNSSLDGINNVQVIIYDANFNQVRDTWTDNSGNYSIQKLYAGDYKVFFNAGSAGNFLDEWYNDKNNFENADFVTISAGNTTTINPVLTEGGTISGRVTDTSNNGIEGVSVQVCDLVQCWLYGTGTDSNGDYTIPRVKAGNFKVDFRPYGLPGNYVREWYDNQGTFNNAAVVNVTAGNTTANINAQLSNAGSISGRVTDSTGNGIANVDISVCDSNGNGLAWSSTDGNGDYTVNSIPSGYQKVQFWPWNAGNYIPEWYNDQAAFEQAESILVVAGETVTGIDAQLADSGAISGRVTNAAGTMGLPNISVQVCDMNGYWYPGTNTDNDGYYTLRLLPAGNYKIDFRTHWGPGNYIREWYNDQNSFENATPVSVTVGQTTTGIDAALADGGAIGGRVTDSSGTLGLANVDVQICDLNGNGLPGMSTDGDGYYTVHGLAAGSYKVQFTTHNAVGSYVAEWYSDKNSFQNADAVTVTVGQTTTGIDAQLADGGYISGRVTNTGSKGVANVDVNVYDTGGNMLEWSTTDSSGNYTVKGLPAGDHHVQFWTYNAGNYLEEWYNDKNSQSEADPVTVTAGNTTGNINAQLATGGMITGKVMDSSLMGIANVTVCVYDTNGNWRNNYTTDGDGDYTINRLPTGSYKIYFETGGAGNYIREWYNDKTEFDSANAVGVTAGNTTKNINAVLADGGAVSGRVTDATGTVGIANVSVHVYDLNHYEYPGTGTDSDGNYTLTGLPAGDYKIEFRTNWTPGNWVGEWYNDRDSFENADAVTIMVNQTTTGIDAQLADGGGISGRVTDSTGTVGIPNVNINICDLNQQWLNGVSTDNNGYYTLHGVPAGTYKIQFYAQHLGNYANEWWNNKRRFETGDEVTVTTGNTTENIDAQLEIKGSITGTVTAASTSTPIEYVHVYVYDLANNEMGNLWTDSSGHYTVNNLDPDNYKVYFNTYDVPLYIEEWYNDKNSFDNADEVTVNENASTTVDAALAQVQDDGYEPNDDFEHAAEITTGTYNDLVYLSPDGDYQGDQDWYKIYVGADQAGKNLKVNLRVTSPYPENRPSGWSSDLDFDILDGTGRILGKVLSGSDNETLYIANLAEGWYYIALKYCTVNYGPDGTGVHAVYSMTAAVDTAANLGIGQISGRVTNEQDQGIGDSLALLMHNPYDWSVSFPLVTTDANGYYTIGYVPGDYTLQFNYNNVNDVPPTPNYVSEYYNDKALLADAQVFSLHAGATITGIDAVLMAGATIEGTLTHSNGNPVVYTNHCRAIAFDKNSKSVISHDYNNDSGNYSIKCLPPGTYKVQFRGRDENWALYAREWYDNKPSLGTGDDVVISTVGQVITGIDNQFSAQGRLRGRVTNGNNEGIGNVQVEVYSVLDPGNIIFTGVTDGNGDFIVRQLPAGDMKIYFNADVGGTPYVSEWYDNTGTFNDANTITLTVGQIIDGIDAQLASKGNISGRVNDASGTNGIANVNVNLKDMNNNGIDGTRTDENGYYSLDGIPAGDYKVEFSPNNVQGNYLGEWYNDKSSFENADTVTVNNGQTTGGIDAQLAEGGAVSGRVTDASGTLGISGVDITAYDAAYNWIGSSTTDSNGDYTINRLPAGNYKIEFTTNNAAGDYMGEWYNDKSSFENADAVTVTVGQTTGGVNAQLAQGGAISGRVTDASGTMGIANVDVCICDPSQHWYPGTQTDSDGYYTLHGIQAGNYKIQFRTNWTPGNYVGEWYNDKYTFESGDTVAVTTGQTTTGIDAQLANGGAISGRVTDETGTVGISNVHVDICDMNQYWLNGVSTDENGYYTIYGLPSGSFKIKFNTNWANGNYSGEWYDNKSSFASADAVTVIVGMTTPGIDAQLSSGGSISGRVTDATGTMGIPYVGVNICDLTQYWYNGTSTDINGYYTISGLPGGDYKIQFSTNSTPGNYIGEWYNDKNSFENADAITVTVGQAVTGIDAQLAEGGAVSGRVTDSTGTIGISNVSVQIRDLSNNWYPGTNTDGSGYYTIHGLPARDYKIEFRTNHTAGNYVGEWYNDKTTFESADIVTVMVGQTHGGIDAQLAEGGAVSGRVTDASGTVGIANVDVGICDSNQYWYPGTGTDSEGYYTIHGLPAGNYKIEFRTNWTPGNYVGEWYNDKNSFETADAITVTVGQTTTGIDAQLADGGAISGRVTDETGTVGIYNVNVNICDPVNNWHWYNGVSTDSSGYYTIYGLPAGDYKIQFQTNNAPGNYTGEWYNNKNSYNNADAVTVTVGQTTGGIDAQLAEGGSVSGRVTDTGNNGIANVHVQICDMNQYWYPGTNTDSGGYYTLRGLPSGDYKIQFQTNWTQGDYLSEWYNDKYSFDSADTVTVTVGQAVTGIDAQLANGGSISGRVTDATGTMGIANVNVNIKDLNRNGLPGVSTDSDGYYTVHGLPAGDYKIEFQLNNTGGNYVSEWYNDKGYFETADTVTVTVGQTTANIDAQLADAGSISGRVADSSDSGIQNVNVDAYDLDYRFINGAKTDSNGDYTLSHLPAGSVKVYFETNQTGNYVTEWYDDKGSFAAADAITITAGQTQENIDAQLADGGIISGRVSNEADEGIADIRVRIFYPDDNWAAQVTTDAEGNYTVQRLAAGSYKIDFYTIYANDSYLREWYDNKSSASAADLVEVTAGQTTTADAVLAAGGIVSGRVTNDESTGIQGVRVWLRDLANINRYSANTNADGNYTIKAIPTGPYKVYFNAYTSTQNYIPEYYNDKTYFKDGETINVTAGQTITGIDAVLAPGCTISGTVTDESANPLEMIDVYVIDTQGNYLGGVYTDVSGHYRLKGLFPSNYKVNFYPYERNYFGIEYYGYPTNTNYRIEWYDNKDNFLAGDVVSTSLESPATGIDAVLTENGGGISGRITDSLGNGIANASITLYQSEYDTDWYDSNYSDANGNYVVKGLPPGNYKLLVLSPGGFYRREFYDDILDFENATPVPVAAGETTTGIDIVLDKGGLITGRVADNNGNGLPNVLIRLLDPIANKYLGWIANSARTDGNGNYIVNAQPGQWKVMFQTCDPPVNTYLSEFYNDQSAVENASVITVTPEQTVSGIDAVLTAGGGKISGYVKDPNNIGLYNAEVDIYDTQYKNVVGYAFSDVNGYFEAAGLIPGNYKIFTTYKNIYPVEWYSDKTTYETGNTLTVTSGGNTPVTIILGGSNPDQSGISGRLTDSGNNGIANLIVMVYDLNQNYVKSGTSNSNGDYVIPDLAAGSYKVYFDGASAGNYLPEWYDDKGAFDEAETLTLETGQSLQGIDAQLADGGIISGQVTNETGNGIENVRVRVRTLDGYWVGNAYTGADGNYSVQCLASASYKVYFFTAPAVGMYVSEWYNDKMSFNLADPIQVTAGVTTPLSVVLEAGGNMSGRVVNQAQAGIQGVQVAVKDLTNVNRATAITDANGNYLVVGLPVGDYKVYFNPTYSNLNYIAEFYADKDSFKHGDMVGVTLGNTTVVDAELAAGSSISGTVTDDSANPLEIVEVYVYDTAGVYYGGVYTDSSGHYQVNGLPAGNYKVNFYPYELDYYAVEWYGLPRNYNYRFEWYDDQASFITAGVVPVTLEIPTTGIDAVLTENCGIISGRITDGTGNGIAGCTVYAFQSGDDFDWYTSGGSDAEGNYQVKGLPPGNYKVWFAQPANSFYRRQFYDNIFNVEQATPVPVLAGQTTSGIDAVLLKGGIITGRVTDSSGKGIGYVLVRPIDATTNQYIGYTTGNANTDARGYYLINVRAGTWKVMFEANQAYGGYRSEFYNDTTTVETAATFTVNPEQLVSGIDAVLTTGGGTLSGYVKDPVGTGLANVGIEVYDTRYNIAVGPAWTDAGGYFEVPGLLPGNYTIYARYNNVYPSEWYSDKTTYETADAILVIEGRNTPVTIILGGPNPNIPNISGQVRNYAGTGLENVQVKLYDLNQEFIVSVTTNANGEYAFYNIPAGEYKLYSDAGAVGNYISEWYRHTLSFDEAETLTVTAGEPLENIDVGLTAGGEIAGRITNETGQGIQGVRVVVRDRERTWIAAVDSDAAGNYSVTRLVPDSYKVFFNTDNAVGLYVKEWYNDKENFSTADLLVVPAGETTTLDVVLAAGGAVSGTVTDGTAPIENMLVEIYDASGLYIAGAYTDGSGNYLAKGIPAGAYKVNFNPWELNYHGVDWYGLPRNYNYRYQWYNQKEGFVDADEAAVTVGNTTANIDAVMTDNGGGIISGRITDSTGNGISGCFVYAFESYDNQMEWYYSEDYTGTGSDGIYELKGLPTGNYIVLFFSQDTLYKREFYNNKRDRDLADRVAVTAGQTTPGIDAELEKSGTVTGRVTDSKGVGLANVIIRIMDAATNKYLTLVGHSAQTDENGEYEVSVYPGQWKVMFQTYAMNIGGYVSEFYNNRTTVETATVVTVAAEEPTPNIDAVLSPGGGKISGYVKDPTNTGLRNAQVYVFDTQYKVFLGQTVTDSSGYFEVAGLIPGNYKVYTFYNDVYPSEWYSDQTAYENAKSLAVTTGGNTYIEVVLGGDDPVNPGQLRITSPNGGESLTGGTIHPVTWTAASYNPGENVIIEYSLDNGATWKMITSSAANTGSYAWAVPAVNSGTCRVRITSGDGDTGLSDISDEPFGIVSTLPPSIRLMSPKRWISITAGTAQTITWTSTGNIGQVAIEYSTNSGTTWNTITPSSPNTGSYQWTVPDTPSQHCHLRIRLGDGDSESAPFDMTEIEFTIVTTTTPTLTVTSPNGGEAWRVGTAQTITWAKTGNVPNVKIEYTINGGSSWVVIIGSTANTGSYPWTVPNSPSGQCKVRVSDIDGNPTDMSNAVFSITPLPTLTLTSPNGGETWPAGTAHDITWTWAGASGDVKIEYSTDSGTSWNLVTSSAGGGIYSWTVPDTPSQNCLVRVSRNDTEEGPTDVSNGVFTIEAESLLSLEAPNGGEQWKAGDTYRITWTASNLEGNVVIDLYRGDDFDFNIGAVSVNDGRLEWKIPGNFKNADDYRVVIHKDQTEDSSDTEFSITERKPNHPDFDNDGKVDILWRNPVTGQNEVWYMDGCRRKAVGILPPGPGKDFQLVGTADFNRDGKVDILWRDSKNGQNLVWYMDGIQPKGAAVLPAQSDVNWQVVGTGDFNSDGKTDILWRHVLKGLGQVWLMDGVTVTGNLAVPPRENPGWQAVATGDFNDDEKVDILWRNAKDGRNEVWFMDGVIRANIMAVQEQTKLQWQVVGTGDFNGDGHVDILWRRSSDGKHLVWYMDGVVRIGYEYININPSTCGSDTSDLRRP